MAPNEYTDFPERRESLERRLDFLLDWPLGTNKKEMQTFQNRLVKYRDYIFTFLYYENVPPDNNASERAIRNVKVKQKYRVSSAHQKVQMVLPFSGH